LSHPLKLIVGLGNPGKEYEHTRHNVGFMIVDEIAKHFSIPVFETGNDLSTGSGYVMSCNAVLAKPMAFMNRSGPPVLLLLDKLGLDVENMIVVHDDIDLDFGRIKIKEKGGHGGHRGIKSLMNALGPGDFKRVRMGIGRPDSDSDVIDHVLGRFTLDETEHLPRFIERGREAAVTVLCKGTKEGMNQFNRKTQHLN
jgi:PTH1 family peptidyl-tRNA hydrolase